MSSPYVVAALSYFALAGCGSQADPAEQDSGFPPACAPGDGGYNLSDPDGGHTCESALATMPCPGPAPGGPAGLVVKSCSELADVDVLSHVYANIYAPAAQTPLGYYHELTWWRTWEQPCSQSEAETAQRAHGGQVVATHATPYFFQADLCDPQGVYWEKARQYRNVRCDYFDGTTLHGVPSAERLAFLASFLWYVDHSLYEGHMVLSVLSQPDGSSFRTDLCHTTFKHGDWGLCDEVTLLATTYKMSPSGVVAIEPEQTVRTIKGHCN